MVFPVVGGDGKPTGYEISNSLRVGSGRKLSRTFTEVSAERKKHTISCWIKLCILDGENHMLIAIAGSNNAYIRINDDHMFRFRFYDSGDDQAMFQTNKFFRDVSAWYHIVFVYDSAQGTDTNRTKLYVNGEQITSFSSGTYSGGRFPDQNEESIIGNNAEHRIEGYSSGGEFYVADWYYIGNQALSPSDFGETNNNGVWVPKKYEGSFGSTNDTFLEFKQTGTSTDASGIGADTSGEGNHMASTNLAATDVAVDTPTNNFCTWNPLIGRAAAYAVFKEGNLDADFTSGSVYWRATGSIGVTSGKWYAEIKCIDDGGNTDLKIGVEHASPDQTTIDGVHRVIQSWNGYKASGGSAASFGDSYADGDIIGVLLDMDNGTIKFSKNGTMMASSASAYTDLISAMPESGWAFFAYGYDNANVQANFGNPPFSISSGNADANGYGNFEYAVPSGYYALCTKNLAEYG